MGELLLQSAGLGAAGFDPLGAVLLAAAIGAGATRPKVLSFAVAVFVSTVLVGTVLATIGAELFDGGLSWPSIPGAVWAWLELLAAALIIGWLIWRPQRIPDQTSQPRRRISGSVAAFALAGVGFTVTSVVDPTFLATIAIAGQRDDLVAAVLAFAVWVFVSQLMLWGLVVAFEFGAHERLIAATRRTWRARRTAIIASVRIVAVLAAIGLTIDAVYFLTTDRYLIG
ncbi:MAG: hypothetical protein AAFY28_05565 [Actinomycetota bacterium]